MFDTVEVGRRIARLRKGKDMTQLELADVMNVSYQAVSNWERGASMPDMGKLPQLSGTLGVSIDELLGGGRGSALVKHVLEGSEEAYIREGDVSIDDAGEAAIVLKPRQVERVVRLIVDGKARSGEPGEAGEGGQDGADGAEERRERISLESVSALAPFLDEDTLAELAARVTEEYGLDQLAALAPFLEEDALGKMALDAARRGARIGEIVPLAPFLGEDALAELAACATEEYGVGELAAIAPFLEEDALSKLALNAAARGAQIAEFAPLAPFLDQGALGKLVQSAMESGASALAPFLDEETLRFALRAGRRG